MIDERNNKMRKFLCIILIISLLSYSICIYAENSENKLNQETESTQEEKSLEELQSEAEEINKQITENSEKLGVVEEELSKNLLQVQEIDSKIQNSQLELNQLNNEIQKLNKNIQTVETELNTRQNHYEKINKQAEQAIVAMYEHGNIRYLDVLLGSRDILDFVSNYYLISELLQYSVDLIKEAAEQKEEIEVIVRNLEDQKEQVIAKKKEQQKINQVLENTKTSREYFMAKLTEEEKQIQTQIEQYKLQMAEVEIEIRKLAGVQSFGEDYLGGEMIWPIPGYNRITSQYGMRTHPITGLYSLHTGTDVGAPIGANFVAAASGVVTKAGYNKYYGNMVILDHGGGVQTLYAHGSEIVVKLGDLVATGDTVLKVGSTGYSTGPHAHFEIRINGETVDPLDYVKPEE